MILVLKVESTFLSETFEKKFNLLINSALSILTLLLLSNEQNIKPLIKHESFLSNRSKISLVLFILDLCTCVNYYASIKFKMVLEKNNESFGFLFSLFHFSQIFTFSMNMPQVMHYFVFVNSKKSV